MQLNLNLALSQTQVFTKSLNATFYNLRVFQKESDGSLYMYKKWRYAQAPGLDLVKIDSVGNIINNIAFNTSNSFVSNILPASNGFIVGTSNLFNHIPSVMKVTAAGNILWNISLQYTGGLNAQPVLVDEVANKVLIIGSPVTSTPGIHQLLVIQNDTNGVLNSSISYNLVATAGTFGLMAENFFKLSNGNYILTGGLINSCASCFVPHYLLLDTNLNIIASKSLTTSQGIPYNFKFIKKSDDSFYIIGSIMSNTPGYLQHGFVINLDSAFNTIWSLYTDNLSLNFGLEFIDASITSDGGLIIGGNYTNSVGWSDMMLLKMDSLGNIIWNSRYGKNSDDEKLISLVIAADDGIYFSGSGYDTTFVGSTVNGLLIKSDTYGKTFCDTSNFLVGTNGMNVTLTSESFTKNNITVNSATITSPPSPGMTLLSICDGVISSTTEYNNLENMLVFPNPAQDLIVISGYQFDLGDHISLTDFMGKTINNLNFSISDSEIKIQTEGLNSGIYILQWSNRKETISKKIIILN